YSIHSTTTPILSIFLFTDPPPTAIYTLSLHDALPISWASRMLTRSVRPEQCGLRTCGTPGRCRTGPPRPGPSCSTTPRPPARRRSEEHTSELQSRFDLVCRLLLEKKKKKKSVLPYNTL